MKEIDLQKTVFELCNQYPEMMMILKDIGFENITKNGMLQTAGRVMTIPKGCRMRGISLETVTEALQQHGFVIKE